jgi:ATP-dependent exoDNAse (exonuclease V) beta subunit
MNWAPEQQRAIQASAGNLAIRAGAGAGKTGVLVARYLRHVIEENIRPDIILAITYTRRASGEMSERVVNELRKLGRFEDAQHAQVGPISTAHAFCERLLREHPFEAGIDPRFEVLPGADMLQDLAANKALQSVDSLSENSRELLKRFGAERQSRLSPGNSQPLIIAVIKQTVEKFRGAGQPIDLLDQFASDPKNVIESWDRYLNSAIERVLGHAPDPDWQNDKDRIKKELKAMRKPVPQWLAVKSSGNIEEAARLTSGLAEFSALAWRILLQQLASLRKLDFIELEAAACRLVENHPKILEGVYRHVLVDEAQDLNPVQHRLLTAIPCETRVLIGDAQQSIYGFRGADRDLFVRSLADHEIHSLRLNWRSSERIISAVTTVFQPTWNDEFMAMEPANAAPPPRSDSDDVFEFSAAGDPIEIWRLPKGRDMAAESVAEGIKQLCDQGEAPRDIAILVRRRNLTDSLVAALRRRGIPYILGDVSENYFLRQEIYDVTSALLACCDPSDNLALLSLLRSPLVGVSFDAIVALALRSRELEVPVFELLIKEPFADDDRKAIASMLEWFVPLSKTAPFQQAWETLSEIFAKTHLDLRFSKMPKPAQLLANARKLLSIAMEERDMDSKRFADWIENQRQMKVTVSDATSASPDADAVFITTTHQAKGLEWNTVIALDTSTKHSSQDVRFVIQGHKATLAVSPDKSNPVLISRLADYERQTAEREENFRLLYVAMTRAKKRLCLALSDRGDWKGVVVPRLAPNYRPSPNVIVKDFAQTPPTPNDPDDLQDARF